MLKNNFFNKLCFCFLGFATFFSSLSSLSINCLSSDNNIDTNIINNDNNINNDTFNNVKTIKNKSSGSSLDDNGMRHIYYGDDLSTFPNNVTDFGKSYAKGDTWNYTIYKDLITGEMNFNDVYTFPSSYSFSFICSDLIYSNYDGYCKFDLSYSYYGDSDISSGVDTDTGLSYYDIPIAKQFIVYMGLYHYESNTRYFDYLCVGRPTNLSLNAFDFNFDCYVPISSSNQYYCFLGSGSTYNKSDYTTAYDLVAYDYLGDNVNQQSFDDNENKYNDMVTDYRTQINNFNNLSSLNNAYLKINITNTYSSVNTTILDVNVPFYDVFTLSDNKYYLSVSNLISVVKSKYALDLSSYSVNSGVSSITILQCVFDNLTLSSDSSLSLTTSNFTNTYDYSKSSTSPTTLSKNTLVNNTNGTKYAYSWVFTTTDLKKYNNNNYLLLSNLSCGSVINGYYDLGYNSAVSEYSYQVSDLKNTISDLNQIVSNQSSQINSLNNTISALQTNLDDAVNSNFSLSSLVYSVMNIPFMIMQQGLNVEFMGINLWGLLSGVISAMFIIFIIKKIF